MRRRTDHLETRSRRQTDCERCPQVTGGEFTAEASVPVGPLEPSQSASVELQLLAQVSRDTLSHQVSLSLLEANAQVQLHFLPPFECSHRLHTCHQR